MITLKADNRALLPNRGYSYLDDNYTSGQSSVRVRNADDFVVDDYVLFSDFGSEVAEIRRVIAIEMSINTLTLDRATSFAHSESTKVMSLPYNKIRWWRGLGPDWDALPAPAEMIYGYVALGDDTTEWDITRSGGTTRWQWSGVGTDPQIKSYFDYFLTIGEEMATITGDNFDEDNLVEDEPITAVGDNGLTGASYREYFEIEPSTGVSQSDIATGTGAVKIYTNYQDITPDSFYTIFDDILNTTGFAYFQWWNTVKAVGTLSKNPIPYAGFPANSARSIIDDFFSTLNNKELKLISRTDAFNWLNEGYSVLLNELNLINKEYSIVTPVVITTVAGTAEYLLPRNTSRVLSVWDNNANQWVYPVKNANIDVANYENANRQYYLRGVKDVDVAGELYIGFSPTPNGASTYTVRYAPKAVTLVKNYDSVYVPNNEFYCLKDYMLFRASPKLNRGTGAEFYQLFNNAVQRMKINSIKQDNGLDSWGYDNSSIV